MNFSLFIYLSERKLKLTRNLLNNNDNFNFTLYDQYLIHPSDSHTKYLIPWFQLLLSQHHSISRKSFYSVAFITTSPVNSSLSWINYAMSKILHAKRQCMRKINHKNSKINSKTQFRCNVKKTKNKLYVFVKLQNSELNCARQLSPVTQPAPSLESLRLHLICWSDITTFCKSANYLYEAAQLLLNKYVSKLVPLDLIT